MYRSSAQRLFAVLVSSFVCLGLLDVSALEGAQAKSASTRHPKVRHSVKSDRSRPLREAPSLTKPRGPVAQPSRALPHPAPGARHADSVVQRQAGGGGGPLPNLNFDGTTAADGIGVAPSD